MNSLLRGHLLVCGVFLLTTGCENHTRTMESKAEAEKHSDVEPEDVTASDRDLFKQVLRDIQKHPVIQQQDLNVQIVKVENGYVTLALLDAPQTVLELRNVPSSGLDAALRDYSQGFIACKELERAIAKNQSCKGVFWKTDSSWYEEHGELLLPRDKWKQYDMLRRALRDHPDSPELHQAYVMMLLKHGKEESITTFLRKEVKRQPDSPGAHLELGVALAFDGKRAFNTRNTGGLLDEGIRHLRVACEHWPDSPVMHYMLGIALFATGNHKDESVAHIQKVLKLDREYLRKHSRPLDNTGLTALYRMVQILSSCPDPSLRDGIEAVELGRQLIEQHKDARTLSILAGAYAEAGQFSDAVESARRAFTLSIDESDVALMNVIRSRIRLYEAKTPFRWGME